MAKTRKEKIVSKLEDMKKMARKELTAFADQVKGDNPSYAMSWSAGAFTSAAEHDFAVEGLTFFNNPDKGDDDDKMVDIFQDYTKRTVLSKTRNLSNKSTSVTANYVDDCALEVRARFLDDIKFL
jgi:hypothetical protein